LTPLKLPRILDTEPLGCLLSNLIEMTLKLLLIQPSLTRIQSILQEYQTDISKRTICFTDDVIPTKVLRSKARDKL